MVLSGGGGVVMMKRWCAAAVAAAVKQFLQQLQLGKALAVGCFSGVRARMLVTLKTAG